MALVRDRDLERGPKGDHGQQGDTGGEGTRGLAGERGDQGQRGVSGERGPQGDTGDRGPTNKLAVVAYLFLVAGIVAAFWSSHQNDSRVEEARRERVAQINKVNQAQCQSLQNLYEVIRKTVIDSVAIIETTDYYRTHPREKAEALARNRSTLERFRTPPCPADIELGG